MYPGLFRRVAATLIDIAVVIGIGAFVVLQPLLPAADGINWVIAGAVALGYEPLFSTYFCTLGQALMRTRVRRIGSLDRMSIGQSYMRFLNKYIASVFAGPSARGTVEVHPREDLRAIHDEAADTVVVNAKAT